MTETTSFPAAQRVPVAGGDHHVTIRPWTMAQRRELRPLVQEVIQQFQSAQEGGLTLEKLFEVSEPQLHEIARLSTQLPDGVAWDDLLWEDLPTIVQAIWSVCILRPGGGLAGKLLAAVTELLQTVAKRSGSGSSTEQRPRDSATSPAAGAPPPSASATS